MRVEETEAALRARWSPEAYARRLEREREKRAHEEPIPYPGRLLQRSQPYVWIRWFLKMTGLYGWGHRSYLNPELREHTVWLPRLPQAFDGLRVLHLTDLHFDLCPALADSVRAKLDGLAYDLCLITGDFRDSLLREGELGIRISADFIRSLHGPVFGSLGNHDLAEDVPPLERSGMRLLINEHASIERRGERLYIAGVDDSAHMGTDDTTAALRGIPEDACVVLMAHAPSSFRDAAEYEVDYVLSGHTHGGQICLPGGVPLLSHCDCPRGLIKGPWRHGASQGYTSSGTGACRVAVRYFCPGEIVVHTLRSGDEAGNIGQ